MLKVLIADDHAVVRKGLIQILSETDDMKVSGEAENSAELFRQLKENRFDAVILDLSMPGSNGMDIMCWIRENLPKLPVLILSIHPEEQYGMRMMKAGASGYLSKDRAPEELVRAMRKILRGELYVTEALAERMAMSVFKGLTDEKPLHEHLTDREFQVLCGLAAGKPPKVIADELCISAKTVSTYRSRILEKMGFSSNADIIHYGLQHNLIHR